MRNSIVYFFIGLLLLSSGLTFTPNVFSQTQNINIVSYSYYVDNSGYLDVVGEVQNVGPNTVNPVFMTGSVSSTTGTELGDSYCQVWALYLAPQQKAPFYMEFQPPSTSVSSSGVWQLQDIAKIALTVSIANATSSYQYPDLKVSSSSPSIGTTGNYNGVYEVNGIIENYGSQTAENISMDGTFYNSTGTVVAVGNTYDMLGGFITASLAPSATISFQVPAFDLNQSIVPASEKIHSYSLLIQAGGPILQGAAPIVTPSPESSSSPSSTNSPSPSSSSPGPSSSQSPGVTGSPSPTQLKGVNSNSSLNPTAIYVIVIVIVILAVAGTILVLNKRKPHETVKARKKARKKSTG